MSSSRQRRGLWDSFMKNDPLKTKKYPFGIGHYALDIRHSIGGGGVIDFIVFVICMILELVGVVMLIQALQMLNFFRMSFAIVLALLPLVAGFWLFMTAGLNVSGTSNMLGHAKQDVQHFMKNTSNGGKFFKGLFR